MDPVSDLKLSFEEQAFLQVSKLREELVLSGSRDHTKDTDLRRSTRFYRNVYEDVDPTRQQHVEELLRQSLRVLGERVRRYLFELKSAAQAVHSPSGIELYPAEEPGEPIKIVNRRDLANFVYDKDGVLYLKKKVTTSKPTGGRLSFMLHLIAKILKLFETDSFITKRELYYLSLEFCKVKNNPLASQNLNQTQSSNFTQRTDTQPRQSQNESSQRFGSQNQGSQSRTQKFTTNKLSLILDDLCCLIGCSKAHLRVFSQSKGVVFGDLKFRLRNGEWYDCSRSEGVLIPTPQSPIIEIESNAAFLLIIEKDSIMQKILKQEESRGFVEKFKAILFTAKGYPDMNSRFFLHHISSKLKLPVLALTDADPHGLDIVCCYKFGCYSTAHESAYSALPHLKWLGFFPEEIIEFNLSEEKTQPHSRSDVTKINQLLRRPYLKTRPRWCNQLNLMKSLGKKAELEALDTSDGYLVTSYLPNKLRRASWV